MAIRINQNESRDWQHRGQGDSQGREKSHKDQSSANKHGKQSIDSESTTTRLRDRSERCQRVDALRMASEQLLAQQIDSGENSAAVEKIILDIKRNQRATAKSDGLTEVVPAQLTAQAQEVANDQTISISVQRILASAPELLEYHGKVQTNLTELL
jgi:hypothetical protein